MSFFSFSKVQLKSFVVVIACLTLVACAPKPTPDNFIASIKNGDLNHIKTFHEEGFKLKMENNEAIDRAVFIAAQSGQVEILRYLVLSGYPFDNSSDKEDSPLLEASLHANRTAILDILITAGADHNRVSEINGDTPLIRAVASAKDSDMVNLLLRAGADVNVANKHGSTPLMAAANSAKNLELVNRLLKAGADVNAKTGKGWTALHFTANHPDDAKHDLAEIANVLIGAGANIEAKTLEEYTPLYLTAVNNKPLTASVLIENGADVNVSRYNGWKPLIAAVNYAKNLDLVNMLLKAGADVNAKTGKGWTALHFTANNPDDAKHDLAEIANVLIGAGANIEAKTANMGHTPLYLSAGNNKPLTASVLIENGADVNVANKDGWTLLMAAVNYAKNPDLVNMLLKAGAEANAANRRGDTALHMLSKKEDVKNPSLTIDIATALIQAGANLDAVNKSKQTPLVNAFKFNQNIEFINLLMDAGAKIDVTDTEGNSLLHLLSKIKGYDDKKYLDVLNRLVGEGISINETNELGATPLIQALQNNREMLSKYLIDKGADVNAETKDGDTPLMRAVSSAVSMDIVTLLLKSGADVNGANKEGNTLLHILSKKKDDKNPSLTVDIARALIQAGANLDAVDNLKEAPLVSAFKFNQNLDFIKLLMDSGAKIDIKDAKGNSLLHLISRINRDEDRKYLDVLVRLVDAGISINDKGERGATPLIQALGFNREMLSKFLIERGADVSAATTEGYTPLITAVNSTVSKDIVDLLLLAGADVNAGENFATALHWAVYNGSRSEDDLSLAKVRRLINAGANIDAKNTNGQPPIYFAAYHNMPLTVELLIEEGADVNVAGSDGETPLMIAVLFAENLELINSLIKAGADVNCVNENGETPLHKLLKKEDYKKTSLVVDIAKTLIQAGAALDAIDKLKQTPLVNALKYNQNLDLINLLIGSGANVDIKDANGNSPLHLIRGFKGTEDKKYPDVVARLIDAGSSINEKDNNGDTPLMLALKTGSEVLSKILIEKGADVNVAHKNGWTPLMSAVNYNKSLDLVKMLLKAGADVNAKEEEDWTALHLTANYSNDAKHDLAEIATALINAGANPLAMTPNLMPPIFVAARNDKLATLEAMLNSGVDVNASYEGNTLLDYAQHFSYSGMTTLLKARGALTGNELAKYPVVPSPRSGYVTCNTNCRNGDCYRTYSDGRRIYIRAQHKYNALTNQWEWDAGGC